MISLIFPRAAVPQESFLHALYTFSQSFTCCIAFAQTPHAEQVGAATGPPHSELIPYFHSHKEQRHSKVLARQEKWWLASILPPCNNMKWQVQWRIQAERKIIILLTAPKTYISLIFVIVSLPNTLEDLTLCITPVWELKSSKPWKYKHPGKDCSYNFKYNFLMPVSL